MDSPCSTTAATPHPPAYYSHAPNPWQSQLPWAGIKQTLTDAGWHYHSPERGANSKLK